MKSIENESHGTHMLSDRELVEVRGGSLLWAPFFTGLGGAVVIEIIRDWDNFKNGLMGRPERKLQP